MKYWRAFKRRYILWMDWKRLSNYSFFTKILILLKIKKCPWFEDHWVKKGNNNG